MASISTIYSNPKSGKTIFILSLLSAGYWIISSVFNVYASPFVSVVFELLWLPMLISLLVLPILSFIFLLKEKEPLQSYYLYSLLLSGVAILMLIYAGK